ncbi:MAG: hypothetical protein ACUVRV_08260 [Cyanobacteriota bacterium]
MISAAEQRQIHQALEARAAHPAWLERLLERQRQTVALPCWGIAGLALLEGFLGQPLGWIAAVAGGYAAIGVQRWGWKWQARCLLLDTFQDIEKIEKHLVTQETPPRKEG